MQVSNTVDVHNNRPASIRKWREPLASKPGLVICPSGRDTFSDRVGSLVDGTISGVAFSFSRAAGRVDAVVVVAESACWRCVPRAFDSGAGRWDDVQRDQAGPAYDGSDDFALEAAV